MEQQNRQFGVSLTEEEYVSAQHVLLKATSPLAWIVRPLSPFLLGWILFSSMLENGVGTDTQRSLSLFLLLIVQVLAIVWMPKMLKKRQREQYRAALMNGYSFDGVVEINEEAVIKYTVNGKTEIPFSTCPLFVESRDVMIFCNQNGKHILLPASYLTEDDAEFLRQTVMKTVAANRRKWLKKLEAKAQKRHPLPSLEPVEEEELYVLSFQYTKKEFRDFVLDITAEEAMEQLPRKLMVFVFVTALLLSTDSLMMIPVAVAALLVWVLFPLVWSPVQVNRIVKQTNGAALAITVKLTALALYIQTQNGTEQRKARLLWKYVKRAVVRNDCVDFYTDTKMLTVPRRCIDDMKALERVVDACRQTV